MSFLLSPELRLGYAILLAAAIYGGAWVFARRWESDRLRVAADAFLLLYLVQYVSVGLPGVVGVLNPLSIALVGIALGAAMFIAGRRGGSPGVVAPPQAGGFESASFVSATLFVLGYAGALIWLERQAPITANDALTYHLPAAAQWLQTHRLSFYEAWYYNPANSYSPLGGSTYIAWLMAPMGNDVLARFVQIGPFLFLFLAMTNLLRSLGAKLPVAAILAAAAVLVRTYISQTILAKDDLFVAAFFIALIESMRRERLEQPIGPWRIGIALGLLLATKFTVLLSLPILLLMLGHGWTWRRAAIAIGLTIALAGPWYLRNWILVGNPLYPAEVKLFGVTIFRGMLHLARSHLLATASGTSDIFTHSYYAIAPILAVIVLIGWAASAAVEWRSFWRDRLQRATILGPLIGIALFVAWAPYGEMRFAYPALLLLFAAGAIGLARLPQAAQIGVAIGLALLAAATAFPSGPSIQFTITALIVAGLGFAIGFVRWSSRVALAATTVLIALVGGSVYVYWSAYVDTCAALVDDHWSHPSAYPDIADVWHYARTELPPGATIAYADTYFTYPLMGYTYDHRVVYVPTRHDLERFFDMPPVEEKTTGEEITHHIELMLRQNPDRDQWLRRLRASRADYLVVLKRGPSADAYRDPPPELLFANADPANFQRVYDSDSGTVFKIVRDSR